MRPARARRGTRRRGRRTPASPAWWSEMSPASGSTSGRSSGPAGRIAGRPRRPRPEVVQRRTPIACWWPKPNDTKVSCAGRSVACTCSPCSRSASVHPLLRRGRVHVAQHVARAEHAERSGAHPPARRVGEERGDHLVVAYRHPGPRPRAPAAAARPRRRRTRPPATARQRAPAPGSRRRAAPPRDVVRARAPDLVPRHVVSAGGDGGSVGRSWQREPGVSRATRTGVGHPAVRVPLGSGHELHAAGGRRALARRHRRGPRRRARRRPRRVGGPAARGRRAGGQGQRVRAGQRATGTGGRPARRGGGRGRQRLRARRGPRGLPRRRAGADAGTSRATSLPPPPGRPRWARRRAVG